MAYTLYLGYIIQQTAVDTAKVQHAMELRQFFFARLQSLGSSLPVHKKYCLTLQILLSLEQ